MCLENTINTSRSYITAYKVFGRVEGKLYPIFCSALQSNFSANLLYPKKENAEHFRNFDEKLIHDGMFHAFILKEDAESLKNEILNNQWNTWDVEPVVYMVNGFIYRIGTLRHHSLPPKIGCVISDMRIIKEI